VAARHVSDPYVVAAIGLVPRFVALITSSGSAEARFARMAIRDAADRLPEVPFYLLDEDSEGCQRWLAALGLPVITAVRSPGTGSLLWVSRGHVLEFSGREQQLTGLQIAAKTRALFHIDSETLRGRAPTDLHPMNRGRDAHWMAYERNLPIDPLRPRP
jgi:hypothetical protein